MKKVLALVLASMMVLALCGVAFAADPTGGTISVTNLENDTDLVKYYQVFEWNDSEGWVLTSDFAGALDASEIATVKGDSTTPGQITAAIASKLVAAADDALVPAGEHPTSGTWTKENQAPGMYLVLVVPEKVGVIYNPMFVSVTTDNNGNSVDAGTVGQYAVAKKSEITVDKKTADHADSHADSDWGKVTDNDVGDIIDFKIEVDVPAYLESYTNPIFTVSDTMTSGLTRSIGGSLSTITVKDGDTTLTAGDGATNAYQLTKNTAAEFEISFNAAYLKSLSAAKKIVITYSAEITAEAKSVNPETNTVKIEYSRNPKDNSDHGTKEDKTTHYTFSIDAELFGDSEYTTSEIVKVGLNEDGTPLEDVINTYSNKTEHAALAGAEFQIFTDSSCTTPYTNDKITNTTVFVTDDHGRFVNNDDNSKGITGLDAGVTYYLKETKAPTGYMLLDAPAVSFEFVATYKTIAATETCNAYQELDSYVVKVNGSETVATFTLDNGTIVKDSQQVAGDGSHEIENYKGVSLPSTGGIGTTIFYVSGMLMVLGAGTILVARRKADEE